MLLISIPDKMPDDVIQRITRKVYPMKVCINPLLASADYPLEEAKIWLTYGTDVTVENIEEMPSLKWIQVFQSGVEGIPFDELKKRNILLTNIKGIHGIPMTEYALSTILYFTRKISRYNDYKSMKKWFREEYTEEAYGKTISIFGAGAVGQAIAQGCKHLGMKVIGVNTTGQAKPHFDEMYAIDRKEQILARSDVVILLLPLTQDTYHMFGKREFKCMKKSAYFINLGRGPLVKTDDLIACLQEKEIQGAAVDVFDEEPLPAEHPLWEVENLLLTPHIAARTEKYYERSAEKFFLNLEAYKNGETPPFFIQLDRHY